MNECLNKKVVLIGNTSVGKSCIIHRKTRNQFSNYKLLDTYINGDLTLGENIADLGGVTIAIDILKDF